MSLWTPAPRTRQRLPDRDSVPPRPHPTCLSLLVHAQGGVLAPRPPGPVDSSVRKLVPKLALCSLPLAPALIPGASESVPGTVLLRATVVLVTSSLPFPPTQAVPFPMLTLPALGPAQAISGLEEGLASGGTSVPCSCAPCPCESLSAECLMWERVSVRKLLVRPPGSWKERVPGGQHQLPPICSPSLLSAPHGGQKPALPTSAFGRGFTSHPLEKPGGSLWQHVGLQAPKAGLLGLIQSNQGCTHPVQDPQGNAGPLVPAGPSDLTADPLPLIPYNLCI